jgi:polygalacturonase
MPRPHLLLLLGVAACTHGATRAPQPAPVSAAPAQATAFSNPAAVKLPSFPDRTCPVAAGADTEAINAAIASCSQQGGGTVSFAPGTYTVGSIHLASHVKLALNGATLRGTGKTDDPEPYTTPIACQDEGHRHFRNALIWGERVTNVAIVGPGTIDGGGLDSNMQKQIALRYSTVMLFENFTQVDTGHFAYLLTDCQDITMSRLTMHPRRDGVDLMQCSNVNAHDLTITGGGDDAFALKSDCTSGKQVLSDNITVRDSTFGSGCNALQIGSETWGDFQNVTWSNIKVVKGNKSGIGIQTNDGAVIRNMLFENISMTGTSFPIFMGTTHLLRGPTKVPGHAENIVFRNVTADGLVQGNNKSPQETAIVVTADAAHPHTGIVFDHVQVNFPGGGSPGGDPPEAPALTKGPEYNPRFITPIPAWGLFLRHVRRVELRAVKLTFGAEDGRPAVIARDVEGLVFDGLHAQKGAGATLALDGVKGLAIKASTPLPDTTLPAVEQQTF